MDYAQSYIELMRAGISEGYVIPAITLKGVEGTIEPHIVKDATESLLFAAFEKFPDDIGEDFRASLTEAGKSAIMNSVVPGYEAFFKFMTEEYLPAASDDIAASSLPNGKAYYEHRVRLFTTMDITPKEVHDIGHSEVKRIRGPRTQTFDPANASQMPRSGVLGRLPRRPDDIATAMRR